MVRETLMIIGSGPAGYTAGIYAARAGLDPLLIKGSEPGGQLMITTEVENWPGLTTVQGPDLMKNMEAHAKAVGVRFVSDFVQKATFQAQNHLLQGAKDSYTAKAVIVATGAQAKWLGLPSEEKFRGFGVSACATCDGPFFKEKTVAVVGGGNTAVEEALFLTHHAKKVYLIHRRDQLRADHVLQKRLLAHDKIEILWNCLVDTIEGKEKPFKKVQTVHLKNTQDASTRALSVDGLFVAIGHTPNTGFLKGQLALDSEGYIVGQEPGMLTEVEGVFTAGDVRDKVYRQAITAAGQGCMAALDAERYLAQIE
ncbi:MAG: thioredoxin-disulfide reductase [Holosporaceae bacterium]